jgi:hypothetical protein
MQQDPVSLQNLTKFLFVLMVNHIQQKHMRRLFTKVHQILTSAIHRKPWRITPIPLGFVIQQQIQCFAQISRTHCAVYCRGRITV